MTSFQWSICGPFVSPFPLPPFPFYLFFPLPPFPQNFGLDAKSQIPYSRRLKDLSTWTGPHLGFRNDEVSAAREAFDRSHGSKRRASDILRTPDRAAAKPRRSWSVQSLPEKYRVLSPPGTQRFRGLFFCALGQLSQCLAGKLTCPERRVLTTSAASDTPARRRWPAEAPPPPTSLDRRP